jgi:predicted GNAT family N-acyltransferase
MNNAIKLAASSAEKEAIYRLRYDIYVLELGKSQFSSDHEKKMLSDEADHYAALFYMESGKSVIGSNRIQLGADMLRSDYNKEVYKTDLIARSVEPEKIAIVDRLMVRPENRRSRVTHDLMLNTYLFALGKGVKLGLITTEEKYLQMYLRYGFRVYDQPAFLPSCEKRYKMVLSLCDRGHLTRVNSPFLNYLPEVMDDNGSYVAAVKRTVGPCFVKCFKSFNHPICHIGKAAGLVKTA